MKQHPSDQPHNKTDDTTIRAKELFEQLNADHGVDPFIDSLGGLGTDAQRQAGESLEALKRPVREMMNQKSNQLPSQLHELKTVVAELEPNYLQQGQVKKLLNRVLRRNPIEQYAKKYQTVEAQVEQIIEGLLSGRDKLQEDTLMLQELKKVARQRINDVNKEIDIGKKLNDMLEEEMTSKEWHDNPAPLQTGQRKVISRIKTMSQAIMVLQQSLASVDMIIENNDKLEEAIFNAITMTKNVVTISASIQLALGTQKKVIDAVQHVNQATESMLLSNAEMLKHNTEETVKTLEEPAIALEVFKKAYEDVFSAIEQTEASNERIVSNGKHFIAELEQLNEDMHTKRLDR